MWNVSLVVPSFYIFHTWLCVKALLVEIKKIFWEIFERCVKISKLRFLIFHSLMVEVERNSLELWLFCFFMGFFQIVNWKLLVHNELDVVLIITLTILKETWSKISVDIIYKNDFTALLRSPVSDFQNVIYNIDVPLQIAIIDDLK